MAAVAAPSSIKSEYEISPTVYRNVTDFSDRLKTKLDWTEPQFAELAQWFGDAHENLEQHLANQIDRFEIGGKTYSLLISRMYVKEEQKWLHLLQVACLDKDTACHIVTPENGYTIACVLTEERQQQVLAQLTPEKIYEIKRGIQIRLDSYKAIGIRMLDDAKVYNAKLGLSEGDIQEFFLSKKPLWQGEIYGQQFALYGQGFPAKFVDPEGEQWSFFVRAQSFDDSMKETSFQTSSARASFIPPDVIDALITQLDRETVRQIQAKAKDLNRQRIFERAGWFLGLFQAKD
jgi:hypothetical protein